MRSESGSVYVEFSIVVPLFLLLTAGIYAATLLLGNMAILVPTSYEALHAGAGRVGADGESAMDGVSHLFVTILGDGLEGYTFAPSYNTREQETANGTLEVPVVEVELMSGVANAPTFATLGLDLTLVGPHVGRDLSLATESFQTLNGPYDCDGMVCSGVTCPSSPCGSKIFIDPASIVSIDDMFDSHVIGNVFDGSDLAAFGNGRPDQDSK